MTAYDRPLITAHTDAADRVAAARAEIARLRALGEAATPGPWRVGRSVGRTLYNQADRLCGLLDRTADAAHIAAWDPARVLRVLDAADKTLDRHAPSPFLPDICGWCSRGMRAVKVPCPDAAAILDLYAPETP